jgi:hypothetical protein
MKYHILNPEDMLTYIFPQRSAKKLCKATELLGRGNARYGVSHVPDIKMSFLSESGKVLRKEVIKHKTSMGGTEMQTSRFSYVLGSSEPASSSMLQVTLEGTSDGVKCMVLVDTNSEYRILTKVSEDILTKTDKVVISYSHSKEHAGFDEFNK